jgi:hypothetical protein
VSVLLVVHVFPALGCSPSERYRLLEILAPLTLRPDFKTLERVFESVYDDIALWFRGQVRHYGKLYLSSDAGKEWQETYNSAR